MLAGFLDTNAILHYPPLSDIDWCAVCQSEAVKLVLCLPVVQELDRHKSHPRLAGRAQARIRELLAARDTEIRPGVRLEIYNVSLRREEFPDTLSIDEFDDKIVHLALKYRDANGLNVAVVSEDAGMLLRCESHGVRTVRLPIDKRLADAPSDEARKLHECQRELADLKNRRPRLELRINPGPEHVHEIKRPVLPDIKEMLIDYRRSERWAQAASQRSEEFEAAVHRRLRNNRAIADENPRTICLHARLSNSGGAPATGITVTMNFPAILTAVVYSFWLDGARTQHEMGYMINPLLPEPVQTYPASFGHQIRPLFGHVSKGVLTCEYPQLAHDAVLSLDPIYLTFAEWDQVRPFQIEVSIRTLVPPDMQKFRVPVRAAVTP